MIFEALNDRRGYVPLYRAGTHCPGCGGTHWQIGRSSAECAQCGTALPIAPPQREAAPVLRMPAWADRL